MNGSQNPFEISVQKLAHLFQQRMYLTGVGVSKVCNQNQIIPQLLQRALGDVQEPRFVRCAHLAKPLGDVRRYRHRRPLSLRNQPKKLVLGQDPCELVCHQDQRMRPLPNDQILKTPSWLIHCGFALSCSSAFRLPAFILPSSCLYSSVSLPLFFRLPAFILTPDF